MRNQSQYFDRDAHAVDIARGLERNGWTVHGLDEGNVQSFERFRPASWHGFATKQWGPEAWQIWVFGICKSAVPTPNLRPRINSKLTEAVARLVASPQLEKASYFVAKVTARRKGDLMLDLWHPGRGLYSHRDPVTRTQQPTPAATVVKWVEQALERPEPALSAQALDPNRPIFKLGEGLLENGVVWMITTGLTEESVDITFSAVPTLAATDALRRMGFRYAPSRKVWYGPRAKVPAEWLALPVDADTDRLLGEGRADEITAQIFEKNAAR